MNNNYSVGAVVESREKGFSDAFDDVPNWLRWIMCLPVAVYGYIMIFYMTYLSWFWYSRIDFTKGLLGEVTRDIMFVVIPLLIIHECVPKFKFLVSVFFSVMYIIISLGVMSFNLFDRPETVGIDSMVYDVMPGLVSLLAAVVMLVLFMRHKKKTDM